MAYYTATGNPPAATKGLSALLRNEFLLIQQAFAALGVPGSSALGTPFKWSTSTTMGDPGAGYLRVNNATLASATAAAIDLLNSNGVNVSAMLALMGTSTNPTKALLRLTKLSDTTQWVLYTVSALTSPGGYQNPTIAYVSGSATFLADDDIQVEIAIVGNKGDQGVQGINGNALTHETRTANTKLTVADCGKLIEITSGTFAQTIDPKSTFVSSGATGTLIYWNSGTGVVTFTPDTALPDLIDSNTTRVIYSGEMILLAPKGTGWTAIVLRPFVRTDTAAGSWQPEPGYAGWWIDADGSGTGGASGGGAGSGRGVNTNSGSGGSGGGGGNSGQNGQHGMQFVPAIKLAAKITGAGRGTIPYAPGAGGPGGASAAGGAGALSGAGGNPGTVGNLGTAGNATTFGTTNDAYYMSVGGGLVGNTAADDPRGQAGNAGNNSQAGGAPGQTDTAATTAAALPDINGVIKGPTENPITSAVAGVTQSSVAPGTNGGRGSDPSRNYYNGPGDVAGLGATNAPGGVGTATIGAGVPTTPATPPQAPPGCGGYGGGGGGGSAGVGAGGPSATAAGGNSAPGGLGGPGQISIRGVR